MKYRIEIKGCYFSYLLSESLYFVCLKKMDKYYKKDENKN
jgi:hypothetical protein